MHRLINFLKLPHPFIFNRNSIIIPFIVTVVILLIFKPFEFNQFSPLKLILVTLIFASIVASSIFLAIKIGQLLLPKFLAKEQWIVGKEIILISSVLVSIILIIFLLFLILYPSNSVWLIFKLIFVRTILISLFPIFILVLYEQYYYQKIQLKEATLLNEKLQQIATQESANIVIKDENEKIALQISPSFIIYAKSEGNYIEIFYLRNKLVQKELIRNRLKILEEELPSNDFFRCHKSYIVNLKYILKFEGNARSIELVMQNIKTHIPVSRRKSKQFHDLFKSLS